ncbi:glycoside hydrolase family 92 protein [Hypholoma sublateritium FD-334 SS-4]|uniref:Glycoside hydrolase family 92 protein n=1 Tax=Hypholoma sublateritium (strain FD-334 SS-4) TaxID=945553 RepID=A0A0D2PJ82_HYPSF|nr:glycoside hydrolase family 92 protein [Hypholoma sublateritium FD-334 SS-4]
MVCASAKMQKKSPFSLSGVFYTLLSISVVFAQPSPNVQKRISQAIAAASNQTDIDYTAFVNPFIGTDNFGDVCPGASIPFGMAKFSPDMTGYAPAGYVTDNTQFIRGMSPLHDSGTGSSLGTYGNFEIMPLLCPGGFDTCTTTLAARERLRKNNTDDASPGYFSLTLDNNIQMEATATRRAGLERFTFPTGSTPYFVLDLANDLPASFAGGNLTIDPTLGRVMIGGHWGSSFGPGNFHYQAFACYDLLDGGKQELAEYGVWTGDTEGLDAKGLGQTHLNLSINLIGGVYESGALFSYANKPKTVNIRVGVSFRSEEQACANAESEIGNATFEEIEAQAKALWQEKLSKIEIDVPGTPPNVTEMLYSSLYRGSLTPNNATDETQGVFENTTSFYFDSLYCSWDTFRTFYPLMALHSPVEFAQIVDNYIDGWRKNGWMPECRANNLPGWTQGGSSGDNIVAQFAVSYHNEAEALGIDLDELYAAVVTDAEVNPPEWNIEGRQSNVYNQYGYVPFAVLDVSSTGRQTREGSRTLEYAFEDFGIRQVAQVLGKADDVAKYTNRSLSYRNVWDAAVTSDGFKGFSQKRYSNGTFFFVDPVECSPNDPNPNSECSLQGDNESGFYEASSWEYSWYVPHDTNHLIQLMGGNDTFVKRLDHFFSAGYFDPSNEPSFQTPIGYHYANQPTKSVDQVRKVVLNNFDITPAGLPGNDDQGAMATVLSFHLLGLYPVPSSTQLLVLSPFTPKYTIHNSFLNVSTTVTTVNYNAKSVQTTIPAGVAAYVKSVTVNGVPASSRCHVDFYDTFRVGGDVVITLTSDKTEANSCLGSVPESISAGGFTQAR